MNVQRKGHKPKPVLARTLRSTPTVSAGWRRRWRATGRRLGCAREDSNLRRAEKSAALPPKFLIRDRISGCFWSE